MSGTSPPCSGMRGIWRVSPKERVVKPSTAEPYPAEQVRNQKAITATCSNVSQPNPLPPKKRKADDEGTSLLDCPLEIISDEEERIEWLYQAIDRSGDTYNYCQDPEFQDEGALFEVWDDIHASEPANYNPPPPRTQGFQISSGLMKVLEPQKSGRSSASRLVRTDHTTIGLDGVPVNTPNTREYGRPAPAKLSRTDHTTIGLDGTPVNTPNTREYGHPTSAKLSQTGNTISPAHTHANIPAPAKLIRTDQ
ncbi:hypothetical protein FRC10_012002 [Ceratobasidium sp. 414]|nr:hypothetical protein FRC10_012002 [Ceratobasidium sp. 414]